MNKTIVLDGVEYELVRKIPEPKFKVNDAIQYINGINGVYRISHLSNDRYFLDGGNDYVQFIEQDKYKLVGVFKLELVENAKG